jgi:hypothetical protein
MANIRISASLSQKDQEAVMEAMATIKEKLPFLIDLTANERKSLPKLGDKSRGFVKFFLLVSHYPKCVYSLPARRLPIM